MCSLSKNLYRTAKAARRESERNEKRRMLERQKAIKQAVKSAEAQKHQDFESQAARSNAAITRRLSTIDSLLATELDRADRFRFTSLKHALPSPPHRNAFTPPPASLATRLLSFIPAVRRRRDDLVAVFENRYRSEMAAFEKRRAEIIKYNDALDTLQRELADGDPGTISLFFQNALTAGKRPDWMPAEYECAYTVESRLLTVNFLLPAMESAIPTEKEFKYVKRTESIASTPLPESRRKTHYRTLIEQQTLSVLHRCFHEDQSRHLDTVALNAFVRTEDRATGNPAKPCLISLRVTREKFEGLNLRRVDASQCLKHLNASVSPAPAELVAVKPVVVMNMTDGRFIEESDVLSSMDTRQNLMELSPQAFETLIANLFKAMGLETRQTQLSGDGGVDCVAFDTRPIFGGKVIIQAKRYKNTVGVSAVRDLFGTMQNEGASKGILITTSGYGSASFAFASGKPIELLDGGHLLHLLKEHVGLDARIIMPDDQKP